MIPLIEPLDGYAVFTAIVIVLMMGALIRGFSRTEHLFVGALILFLITGIVTPVQALAGFTNTTVITVGALFVVAEGVRQSRLFSLLEKVLIPKKRHTGRLLLRVMGSTSVMSSILNNTPIVAMFIPQLERWAARLGIPVSKLLIPLSYAAITGGIITVIGTSTNLIVSEMLSDRGHGAFNLFQLAWIGIPATILVIVWFVLIGHKWLPVRPSAATLENYSDEKLSRPNETAVYENAIPAFNQQIFQGDFAFSGTALTGSLPSGVYTRGEIADNSVTPGRPAGNSEFRIGNGSSALTLLILIFMIGFSASGLLPIHQSVIGAAVIMIVTGLLPLKKAAGAVNFSILIVIASALGVGKALENTGLAESIAFSVINVTSGSGLIFLLIAIYLLTNLLTEVITNNAAAVMMLPVALSASQAVGLDAQAVGVTVAVAASASFLSPIGYQTNLMVMKPGGYCFTDYIKAGLPVTIILMTVTVLMVTWLWT